MEEPTFTVPQIAAELATLVVKAFPEEVWVRGQIRDLSRPPSGHVYFTLVDPAADSMSSQPAQLPVSLFAGDKEAINRLLMRGGAVRMTDGVEVRIRGRLNYYQPRGNVQLQMSWIDADFTLGRLAAERERLLGALESEGLLVMNRALRFPIVPLRVGLVTSEGSAAHADFLHELEMSGFGWEVLVADARVQGLEADVGVPAALRQLGEAGVDVACVVRGGGARTDLAPFDREPIARAIATHPVPVLTGIGHEVDSTIADVVAHQSFKTPTACAVGLVERVRVFQDATDATARRIAGSGRHHLDVQQRRTNHAARRIAVATVSGLRAADQAIGWSGERLLLGAAGALEREEARLAAAEALVGAADPGRILARGFSITRTADGSLVRGVGDVTTGAELVTDLADGTARSRVERVDPARPIDDNPGHD
jgi:exodeoxyribonuclease VII large subunit